MHYNSTNFWSEILNTKHTLFFHVLTPLKYYPMTVRTESSSGQPSQSLSPPMPMHPGPQGWSHESLSQWCQRRACPPLPPFLLYLAMGLMSLPGLGLSSFPWRCPMPRIWSASRSALLGSLAGDRGTNTGWKVLHYWSQPWSLCSPAFRELLACACLLFTVKTTMPMNKLTQ